ncbi:Formyltransferase [Gautieria morchelliformis]|nr:Formyltransferase [Gautieria morchelliformis]
MLKLLLRGLSTQNPLAKFNILFLGQDDFSCTIFRRLHAATDLWKEIWVGTNADVKPGRRRKEFIVSPLKVLADSLTIPVHDVPPKEIGLKSWEVPGPFYKARQDPNNILITASFGRIIPVSMLNLFDRTRKLNVHASLLPHYRGPAPIQHAIVDGRIETGVSILNIDPVSQGIDSGDIWGSRVIKIPPHATFSSLRENLAKEGADLLVSTLRAMVTGTATAVSQDSTKRTLAPLITREFMNIDWDTWDAHRLDRVHRAASHQASLFKNFWHALVTVLPYSPTLNLKEFTIRAPPMALHSKLHHPGDAIYDHSSRSIVVRCAEQTEISVTLLQQENKRVLKAKDFWNGVRPEGLKDGILELRSFPP